MSVPYVNVRAVRNKRFRILLSGALASCALTLGSVTFAQAPPGAGATVLAPAGSGTVEAVFRTVEQMLADEGKAALVPQQASREYNLPTMDRAAYKAAKSQAALQGKDLSPRLAVQESQASQQSPVNPALVYQVEGVNQAASGGWVPPDASAAVGHGHFVQVVNSHIRMFTRPSTQNTSISLNSFVGYFNQPVFDPNIVYDPRFRRWIFSAPAFPESATVQWFFVALSVGQNPNLGWYVYWFNTRALLGNDTFFDYPHIAFDNDAIQWTANIFNAAGTAFLGSHLTTIAKSIVYNGLGGPFWFWTGLTGTLQPTLVRDQNVYTWFAVAPNASSIVRLYAMRDSARIPPVLFGPFDVAVAAFAIPPDATQPGTAALLDTLDNRFQNHSTQRDNYIWNAHPIAFGPSAVRWYRINTSALNVNQSGTTFTSVNSADFNPHITANGSFAFLEWSSTDAPAGINAQIRFSGKLNAETAINGGTAMFTSPTFYGTSGTQRWGDYSQVSLDPLNGARAFINNEKINTSSSWGTRFGQITY